jgi:predicted metal-binding membrane protein
MSEEDSMKLREVVQASEARASRLRRSALRSYEVFAPVPDRRDAASRPAAIESATTTTTAATLTTLGLAAASWVVAVRQMNGMDIGVATELGSFAFFVAVWVSMMAAMMLPGAAPAVSRHARASGRVRAVPIFVGSYVAVWTMVGVAVYALYRPHGSFAAGAVAIAAGVYELTPLKQHFRRRCRESVRSGLEFGLYCVGSSIGLMAMLVALGVMSVTWMSVIAILVLAQKLLPPRAAIRCTAGAVDRRAWSPDRDRALVRSRTHASDVDVRPDRWRGPGQSRCDNEKGDKQ